MDKKMIDHALAAVMKGFWVFPVQPGAKTPLRTVHGPIPWSDWATNSYGTVVDHWTRHPNANIGIACKQSGIVVVDCDFKPDAAPEFSGLINFEELIAKYQMPDDTQETYMVTTPSGGYHWYYQWPVGIQATQSPLAKLVDVRSNGGTHGGYVLGAGSSVHVEGEGWPDNKGFYEVAFDKPLRACPAELVELIRVRERSWERPKTLFSPPGMGNYEGVFAKVRLAEEGNRNATLYWAACTMALEGVELDKAKEELGEAGRAAGLDDWECSRTINSAYARMGKARQRR